MTSTSLERAQAAWSLAPLLAARQSVRLWSPEGGFDRARRLGRILPGQPAAVPIFDRRGRTTLLVLDFDPQQHGRDQVRRDADQAVTWIQAAGGRVVVDESTRGGRHVLVPLAGDVQFAARHLRPVLDELARRLPTLDITPMTNPASGCITAPGSPCKEGGHRRLITPLDQALDAVTSRSKPATIARLAGLLDTTSMVAPSTTATGSPPSTGDGAASAATESPCQARTATGAPLPDVVAAFAADGVLPDRRTRRGARWTRSEARQSVLAHAAVRGLTRAEVVLKMIGGEWAGLRAAYDRYGRRWERAFAADWKKALTWADAANPKFRVLAHEELHTGGAVRLREWLARAVRWTMLCSELEGQCRWTVSAIWQALAYGQQLAGGTTVAQGRRWLSIAAGMLCEQTISDHLRALREIPGAPVLLVKKARGPLADRYALVTPHIDDEPVPVDAELVERARVEPVHPAWAVLGLPTRTVFEAVERAAAGGRVVRPLDLPALTGMSTTQVYEHLAYLHEEGLVERGHGWVRRTARTLTDVAVDHDVAELRAARVERHRAERAEWHALLALWNGETSTDASAAEQTVPVEPWTPDEREDYLAAVMATGPPPAEPPLPPTGNPREEALLALLSDVLGARPLAQQTDRTPASWLRRQPTLALIGPAHPGEHAL
ncbi:hypothetical protein SUDANB95_07945 (plasmid) [Actinosynnema sp. ALI-1.44]